jgi:hypothetical protein
LVILGRSVINTCWLKPFTDSEVKATRKNKTKHKKTILFENAEKSVNDQPQRRRVSTFQAFADGDFCISKLLYIKGGFVLGLLTPLNP